MFCSFEQVLDSSEEAQSLHCLADLILPRLRCICDVRQLGTDTFYRLDDARVSLRLLSQPEFHISPSPPLPLRRPPLLGSCTGYRMSGRNPETLTAKSLYSLA